MSHEIAASVKEEKSYRQVVDDVFTRIDRAFEDVDPDIAECSVSQGTLTIIFFEKTRFIVSPQTPVRQIWVAYLDSAWHFDLNNRGLWRDDKGRDVELFSLIERTTKSVGGLEVTIDRTPAG